MRGKAFRKKRVEDVDKCTTRHTKTNHSAMGTDFSFLRWSSNVITRGPARYEPDARKPRSLAVIQRKGAVIRHDLLFIISRTLGFVVFDCWSRFCNSSS